MVIGYRDVDLESLKWSMTLTKCVTLTLNHTSNGTNWFPHTRKSAILNMQIRHKSFVGDNWEKTRFFVRLCTQINSFFKLSGSCVAFVASQMICLKHILRAATYRCDINNDKTQPHWLILRINPCPSSQYYKSPIAAAQMLNNAIFIH